MESIIYEYNPEPKKTTILESVTVQTPRIERKKIFSVAYKEGKKIKYQTIKASNKREAREVFLKQFPAYRVDLVYEVMKRKKVQ